MRVVESVSVKVVDFSAARQGSADDLLDNCDMGANVASTHARMADDANLSILAHNLGAALAVTRDEPHRLTFNKSPLALALSGQRS
ncbi:MAG: hypothetical protein NUW22_12410 [Acidobacteria bacterium]|nr:hypothetical protein [Acidobacteriota bacterium]